MRGNPGSGSPTRAAGRIDLGIARTLLWFAPALAILLFWPRRFPLDDAYITLHNARSLLGGADPVFGGSPLLGATSAVHLLCVSLLGSVIPLPTASLAVSALCTCLYALGLYRLRPHWAFVGTGLLSSFILVHLLNGLETSMALAAVTWAFVLADSKWLPLLLGLMPYIRPDLALLAVPLGLRQVCSRPLWVVALALTAAAPFALWYWLALGQPFPNTALAKIVFFGEAGDPALFKLGRLVQALFASYVLILAPGIIGLVRSKAGWCGLVYIAAVPLTAFVTLPGSLHFNDSRYLATFVPVLCYGVAALPEYVVYALAAAGVLSGYGAIVQLKAELAATREWFDGARFIASLPPGSTVLVHDVGVAAWLQPKAKLIDVVGLKTPSSVAIMEAHHVRSCRWGPALAEIALRSDAQYVEVRQVPLWKCVQTNLQQEGWRLTPVHSGPLTVFALKRAHPW